MAGAQVLVEAAKLVEARVPFVLATVVWRRGPSSGRAGYKAIILADGTVRGWIGGACAEPTVIERALACLESGEPELLLLGDVPGAAEAAAAPRTVAPMACESDGALEVYMEPMVPPVRVVGIGRSPGVDALASMASALGWDAVIIDDNGRVDEHPRPDLVHTKLDFTGLNVDAATAVVVATQGHYDDLALAAALQTDAGYVGLVASSKRAAAVLDQLRVDGIPDAALARVHAPAGLDLGPLENEEIAAAIIADLVGRHARGELRGPTQIERRTAAQDPICGMTVFPGEAKYHSVHEGHDYWFCASGCKRAFDADPSAALAS